ncbi:MAG: short-chain fatty acids transporter [Maribacter sp.]|jgi:short-chain fatty acids transporter
MKIFQRLSSPFVTFVEKYYPDPFVFVILLTLVTFLLTFGFTDTSPVQAIAAWGGGLSALLAFMAQLSITLITAHALAHTDAVKKGLSALAKIPNSEYQSYMLVAAISGIANLFAWSLGLVVGAIIAKQVAIEGDKKGLNIHYPLLVASAYAGFVIWHMGYSSSSALFVATEGHILEEAMGVIPVTDTIFTSWNIGIALVTLIAITLVCPLMHPDAKDVFKLKADTLEKEERRRRQNKQNESILDDEISLGTTEASIHINKQKTIGDKFDDSKILILIFGLMVLGYLVHWFWNEGFSLNLNIVNWTFLMLGMLLAKSPKHYVELISDASKLLGPILLQYPFYAGIMGLIKDAGLVQIMSDAFVNFATAETLPFLAFLSSGIVNMFVPSGGGQWVIQGPVFIEAANKLGTSHSLIVMGVAYGDQWTNMIQPFWTIPLLAIANLDMRKIMGYTFVILLVTLVTFGGGLLTISFLGY